MAAHSYEPSLLGNTPEVRHIPTGTHSVGDHVLHVMELLSRVHGQLKRIKIRSIHPPNFHASDTKTYNRHQVA